MVFEPLVDWSTFDDPTILHRYWQRSLFFRSEDHARRFVHDGRLADGTLLTLDHTAYSTPITQRALFGFEPV